MLQAMAATIRLLQNCLNPLPRKGPYPSTGISPQVNTPVILVDIVGPLPQIPALGRCAQPSPTRRLTAHRLTLLLL